MRIVNARRQALRADSKSPNAWWASPRSQGVGFAIKVAELAVQVHGLLIATGGFRVVAEMAVGVAQAVIRLGQAHVVIDLALQVQGLPTADKGFGVVAELGMQPAHRIQCPGLPSIVTRCLEQDECPPGVRQRFGVQALSLEHPGEVPVGVGLARVIAQLGEQAEGALEVRSCVIIVTQLEECGTQQAM